jgi:hypothetical protein
MQKLTPYLLILLTLFVSCAETTSDTSATNNEDGNYHFLSDRGIKVFLPKAFDKYTLVDYQNLLKQDKNKRASDFKIERLNALRKMEGNFYIFFDAASQSTFTVNTVPHFEFDKEDANQLLSYIKLTNENENAKKDRKLTKVTAKYTGTKRQQIFKSIHKIEDLKTKTDSYNTAYIISSNDKTVIMQLLAPEKLPFDTYIQKLKM